MGAEGDDDEKGKVDKSKVDEWRAKFQNEQRRHEQTMGRVTELETELTGLRPKALQGEQLSQRIADLEKQHAAEKGDWEVERAAMACGIDDPEGVDVAKLLHSRLPERNRPPIGDWLGGFKADPAKAPKPLQPYLPKPLQEEVEGDEEEEAAAADKAKVKDEKKKPNVNGGVVGGNAAGSGQKPSPEVIRAAAAKARLGDATEYNALMGQMGLRPLPGRKG